MAADEILLDTSLLVHATFSDLRHHQAVWALLDRARDGDGNLCVCVHSLAELAWIVSDSELVLAPDTPELVRRKLDEFLGARFLRKLPVTPATVVQQAELIERYKLRGARTFNALVTAVMVENRIPMLNTLFPGDYAPFKEITAVNPFQ